MDENEAGLFSGMAVDADDLEAERVYAQIDDKMDERRRKRREAREQEALALYEQRNPTIQAQFQDLKKELQSVSMEEWSAIPEVMDMRGAAKKLKRDNPRGERYKGVIFIFIFY